MKWEVSGADRDTGEDRRLVLDADSEDSARRRGNRSGLLVASVRPIDADDSMAGAPATAPPPPVPPPHVGYAPAYPAGGTAYAQQGPLGNGWGIAAVVLGILTLVIAFVPCVGILGAVPLGLVGALLGTVGLIIGYSYRRAVIASWLGLGASLCGIVLAFIITGVVTSGVSAAAQKAQQQAQAAQQAAAQQAKAGMATAQTFTVAEVVGYYAGNEVAGDQALKGKMLKVEGDVDRVAKDLLGSTYVTLKHEPNTFRSVQCFFADNGASGLASLRPDQHVIIYGRCEGLMMNVMVKDCALVTP